MFYSLCNNQKKLEAKKFENTKHKIKDEVDVPNSEQFKSKKKIKKGLKVKPRGKAKPAKGKGKGKGRSIELNGAPEYVEYDLPASAKKKRKGYRDESDVELIDVSEDDEYYNPKKRSRPGPASSKKSKPGPASKKRSSYY